MASTRPNLIQLNLPPFQYRLKQEEDKYKIFDVFRKKYVALTPEEWVRQHVLHFLTQHKNYPQQWTAVEKTISINGLQRRYDALIFQPNQSVLLLIELKAPHVPITAKVFEQISAYNFKIKAPYLMVSNGLQNYFAQIDFDKGQVNFLQDIPDFSELKGTSIN